ncbi:hypothetical protein M9H77_11730 [Catharanthus roseus]|uniref:Uncharacterized protein n=1 Tax=Catharanthus roseus TaxID=4058 RepID=A0ACC0BFH2_CATRO|nr:hypothetical protein M9H77_11730 [Catharanthus roseus]
MSILSVSETWSLHSHTTILGTMKDKIIAEVGTYYVDSSENEVGSSNIKIQLEGVQKKNVVIPPTMPLGQLRLSRIHVCLSALNYKSKNKSITPWATLRSIIYNMQRKTKQCEH